MVQRKAQAATEYLVILAVVVIIALIVVTVMGGIPGIGKSAVARTSSAYWATADIAVSQFSISSTGSGSFTLKNNQRMAVEISTLAIGTSGNIVTTPIQIVPGGTASVVAGNGTIAPLCTANQAYSYPVVLTYRNPLTGRNVTLPGDGATIEGTCTA